MGIKVKRLRYFVELNDGTTRTISDREYTKKKDYYIKKSWDFDEFSKNYINNADFVQYDNCITFYNRDFSITLGYTQKEIY